MITVKKGILLLLLASSIVPVAGAETVQSFYAKKIDLSFETFIRVKLEGKILEAEDSALLGASSGFVQSLRYVAGKAYPLDLRFDGIQALKLYIEALCKQPDEVKLSSVRHNGALGVDSFVAKVKPQFITVTGVTTVAERSVPFSEQITCLKSRVQK